MSSPKHVQLSDMLRRRIADGTYPPGTKLPSENYLTAAEGVSRTTVRQALQSLQIQGLLRAETGIGYFVRTPEHFEYRPQDDFKRHRTFPEADSFVRAASKDGRVPRQEIDVAIVPAPRDVAQRLKLAEGEFVVRRRRLRFLDDQPYQINDSYYPRDVAEGTEIMRSDGVARGVNEVLAERGHEQVRALDEIWVRMPTPEEAERLAVLPGTAVAEHIVTGVTSSGRPVRMVRAVLPGDRNVITFERTHPDHEPALP